MSRTVEEWRPIQGYQGLYEVSDWGRVKSLDRDVEGFNRFGKCVRCLKEKILTPTLDSDGYLTVGLWKNGVQEKKKVHRLVAETFLTNSHDNIDVHHKSHIRTDNRLENLEWISKEEHTVMHQSNRAEASRKVKSVTVYQYTKDGFLVKVWKSASEAARVLGFSLGNISECCNNKRKTHKGYKWSYKPL